MWFRQRSQGLRRFRCDSLDLKARIPEYLLPQAQQLQIASYRNNVQGIPTRHHLMKLQWKIRGYRGLRCHKHSTFLDFKNRLDWGRLVETNPGTPAIQASYCATSLSNRMHASNHVVRWSAKTPSGQHMPERDPVTLRDPREAGPKPLVLSEALSILSHSDSQPNGRRIR